MALRPQNVKKTVTCIPIAAAPVAIMNAAIARSISPLHNTIVTFSGLEICRSANVTAGSICAIVMTPFCLSDPHQSGDFTKIFNIVSTSFSCQEEAGAARCPFCSQNAHDETVLARVKGASRRAQGGWVRNCAQCQGQPRPLP